MIRYFAVAFLLLMVPLGLQTSFGLVEDFTTDKELYHQGDTVIISGNVSFDSAIADVTIWITGPLNTNAGFYQASPNPDDRFTAKVTIGPTWSRDGDYTIKVTHDGDSKEKTVKYQKSAPSESEQTSESRSNSKPDSKPESKQQRESTPESKQAEPRQVPDESKPRPETAKPVSTFTTLKLFVPDFPALDKSPQHYIDRYNNEEAYKSWFDSQFPSHSIDGVVGYKGTHVKGFPAVDKAPQYYIDRYNNEPSYKSWFDSQFPSQSIHNVLGYENPAAVPDWVRSNAEWWAAGEISDSMFLNGIRFLLESNVIIIPDIPTSQNASEEIPEWVRDSAHKWSQSLVSEDEFVDSLIYLVQEGIIVIE